MKTSFWQRLLAKPWVRAQICSTVMGTVLLGGGAAYAAHRANGLALQLGSEIMTNASPTASADAISFNGAHFYFQTQVLNAKLEDVLRGAQGICAKEGADLAHDLTARFAAISPGIVPVTELARVDLGRTLTINTEIHGKTGEVACWVRRSTAPQHKNVFERVRAFTESFDLSEFGSLQYVHAERHGDRTLVRVLWSEGALSMPNVFPDGKDTPGHDVQDLPRPPGSFRVIAAHVVNAERNVVGYVSHETPEQVNAFYAAELPKLGWKEVDLGERSDNGPVLEHAYQRAGRNALLALTDGDEGTGATFIELPAK